MVALVERMLALNKQRAEVKTDHEKNLMSGISEATDNAEIDSFGLRAVWADGGGD